MDPPHAHPRRASFLTACPGHRAPDPVLGWTARSERADLSGRDSSSLEVRGRLPRAAGSAGALEASRIDTAMCLALNASDGNCFGNLHSRDVERERPGRGDLAVAEQRGVELRHGAQSPGAELLPAFVSTDSGGAALQTATTPCCRSSLGCSARGNGRGRGGAGECRFAHVLNLWAQDLRIDLAAHPGPPTLIEQLNSARVLLSMIHLRWSTQTASVSCRCALRCVTNV